ncbi:probable N-acyl homoserine lactonase [Streptomyces sp. NBRC 110611]|uniref:phosphotriesterase family protein n=1 Tax=Streptomyces sp. NBRC 110611 TaxID=1621259 RepID=UPI00083058FD|nr:phosphotriesterase [Streptomyces sp. NBRC 110611]GAU69337.1 probable N-acyl homoserine lactonase [Streptomyces sp. NBRC 110611]
MTTVNAIGGPVDTAGLGRTYMHEHIFVFNPDIQQNWPQAWGNTDDRVADAVGQLRELAQQGVKTIVECTAPGNGRNVPLMQKVARQVPELTIIVSTGLYTIRDLPLTFSARPALQRLGIDQPEPLIDNCVRDIKEGIAGTGGVKAGHLKCAIDEFGLTEDIERVMRAMAAVHHQTGVPITVHTHPDSKTGLEVKRVICDEEGVVPHRVVLGHSGDTTSLDHLRELADHGFWLGFDRFGVNLPPGHGLPTYESRNKTLIEMCDLGYADRIVLSHDVNCYIDWIDEKLRHALLPDWNFLHLGNQVLPDIRRGGVTDEQINTMLVDNPRRIFEGT